MCCPLLTNIGEQVPPQLSDEVNLSSREWWMSYPHETFRRLRAESPVYWSEKDGQYVISKYQDIRFISKSPQVFSNAYGLTVEMSMHDVSEDPMTRARARRDIMTAGSEGDNLVGVDPPRHTFLRKMLSGAFTPKAVARLEAEVEQFAQEVINRVAPETEVDFIESVAGPIPMLVIASMLGVSGDDLPRFRRWSDAFIELGGADGPPDPAYIESVMEFDEYFKAELVARRDDPKDDLLSALAHGGDGDQPFTLADQISSARILLIAGNETTRGLISGTGKLLCEYPDQRALLVKDPTLIPNAIEECLRYVTPVTHFNRTVTEEVEIRGTRFVPGDYLSMSYVSGNRDEEIWDRADEFDVTRKPDPTHLAFGFAEHFCLGQALARREGRIVLTKLLARFPEFEMVGPIDRFRAAMVPGIKTMPVVFHAA